MNNKIKMFTAGVLSIAVLGTAGLVMAAENLSGSQAAAQDESYTLSEMLTYAIQDEFMAQAEYAAIIEAFDVARPYTNIIKAEGRHVEALLPLFEQYQVEIPADNSAGQTTVPATLAETFAIGVDAEERNIAMYESFLKQELPDDVRDVFEYLQAASEKHLAAFTRGVSSDGTGSRFSQNGVAGRSTGGMIVRGRGRR